MEYQVYKTYSREMLDDLNSPSYIEWDIKRSLQRDVQLKGFILKGPVVAFFDQDYRNILQNTVTVVVTGQAYKASRIMKKALKIELNLLSTLNTK